MLGNYRFVVYFALVWAQIEIQLSETKIDNTRMIMEFNKKRKISIQLNFEI